MASINSTDTGYSIEIDLKKPAADVFSAITDVRNWWSKDFEGSSNKLNDQFIIHHPGMHYSKQQLVDAVTDKRLVWLVTDSTLYWLQNDKHEWTGTKMIFELKTEGDKTHLHFLHEGLTNDKECYNNCVKGWDIVIKNWLPYLIDHGVPAPEMNKASEIRDAIMSDTNQKSK